MTWLFLVLGQCWFSAGSMSWVDEPLIKQAFLDTIEYVIYDSFDSLEQRVLTPEDDEVLIVNFWATWCGPCVKELPHFENFLKTNNSEKVRVILISLDFIDQIKSRYVPFIEKHKLGSELYILNDTNENEWIGRVDPEWSGTIPATLFLKGESRIFIESEITSVEELENYITKF